MPARNPGESESSGFAWKFTMIDKEEARDSWAWLGRRYQYSGRNPSRSPTPGTVREGRNRLDKDLSLSLNLGFCRGKNRKGIAIILIYGTYRIMI